MRRPHSLKEASVTGTVIPGPGRVQRFRVPGAGAAAFGAAAFYALNRANLMRRQSSHQRIAKPQRERDPQETVKTRRLPGFHPTKRSQSDTGFARQSPLRHISRKAQLCQAPAYFGDYSRRRSRIVNNNIWPLKCLK